MSSSRTPALCSLTSEDGTVIAYEQVGVGPPVVLVGGALSHRRARPLIRLANALATSHTVIRYDRRGRGESGARMPYAVAREGEDLAAVIAACGGQAAVWG